MLDIKTAKSVRNAVIEELDNGNPQYFTLEDAMRMQIVPQDTHSGAPTILALQSGSCTILVHLMFNETTGARVIKVQKCAW